MNSLEHYFNKLWLYCSQNPYVLRPQDEALYSYAVCRLASLGYPKCLGLPTTHTMMHLGIKKYESYSSYFKALVDAKLFFVLEYSKNQHTANVISLLENNGEIKPALPETGKANPAASPENGKANDIASPKSGKAKRNTQTLNTSKKQAILDAKTDMQDFCFPPFCNEKVSILEEEGLLNNTSSSIDENALPENGIPFSPPVIRPPTIETYRRDALKDKNFMEEMKKYLPDISTLRGWLTNFNRRLLFSGDVNKTQAEYRTYFLRWLTKVPGYKTLDPQSYKLIQDSITNTSNNPGGNITPTEQEIANKIKALRAKQN